MATSGRASYFEVLTEAVNDLLEHGYDSADRVAQWQRRLDEAARMSFRSVAQLEADLRAALGASYARLVTRDGALKLHPGISRFTFEMVKPRLREELNRRVAASRDLIVLNRDESMARQARRFAGWASSIPAGGAAEADRVRLKSEIRKPLASLPYEERRVMIDQSAKLVSALHATIATGGGAIAGKWRHVHRSPDPNARPEHVERDGKFYLIRGSWADQQGLIKGPYTDEIDQPAEKPFCRCGFVYVYSVGKLPDQMLTEKGRVALAKAREAIAA